jgi:ADP-ribose pyrophosphatase YjhB (NUDIX family)
MTDKKVLAASGIILKEQKILLIKRSNYTKIYPGFWACPGGRAEPSETAEQNVIREVKEEVNLNFTPAEILTTATWRNRFLYRFLGSWSGTIKIQEEEVSEFGWFNYTQAKQLNLAFDYGEVIELIYQKGLI